MEGDDKTSRSNENELPESSTTPVVDEHEKAAADDELSRLVIDEHKKAADDQLPESSTRLDEQKEAAEGTSGFVNRGAIAWEENRRKWTANSSKKSHTAQKAEKVPTISWNTAYDDLLATRAPFHKPIPLSEMVDFLDDIWIEEELSD